MGLLTTIAGLPVAGPLLGLGWLARHIADAAEREMNDPARIERMLLALERALEAGEIDEAAFEAQEAELLAELAALAAAGRNGDAVATPSFVSATPQRSLARSGEIALDAAAPGPETRQAGAVSGDHFSSMLAEDAASGGAAPPVAGALASAGP